MIPLEEEFWQPNFGRSRDRSPPPSTLHRQAGDAHLGRCMGHYDSVKTGPNGPKSRKPAIAGLYRKSLLFKGFMYWALQDSNL